MFLDQLCPELFIKSFGSMFRNPKAETETELECEKAFLLCRPFGNSEGFPWLGIEKLGQLIDQTEAREILEKTYGFTAKDYYRLATEKCFDDTFLAGMYAVGNLYFDFGAGFGNEGRRDIRGNFSDGVLRFEQEAELPDGVKAVRFDPIEGNYCRVYGCEISCGEESLEWYAENAVKVGDSWFFGDVDPKIIIPVNPSVKVVHIKAECQIFRQDDLGIAELFQVVNESVRDKQMVEAQREHIKSLMWIKNIEDEI